MKQELLVSDANVLIDFYLAKPELLAILCSEFHVKISQVVMDEITQFTHAEAIEFGMEIIDEELSQELISLKTKGLSFQDKTCISLSKKLNASCLTNDFNLKQYLVAEGFKTYWGLEMLLIFETRKRLSKDELFEIARNIFDMNNRYGKEVQEDFFRKLEEAK